MKIGFLASGNLGLTTLRSLLQNHVVPAFIATDSRSDGIIAFAKTGNIQLFKGNPREGALTRFMQQNRVDVLFSINYLFLVDTEVLGAVKYAINLHGSLLPKYRGRTPHVWAIINNEKVTGVTAHLIDEGCDTGPVLAQYAVPIEMEDTGATILDKYAALYPNIVSDLLTKIESGLLSSYEQDHSKATYFGKRTPDDGLINWNWQRERILNWVRAQAFPYPGAFTRLGGERIIIDRVSFTDHGFHADEPNGLIKGLDPVLVKAPNGVIKIEQTRTGLPPIQQGEIFV